MNPYLVIVVFLLVADWLREVVTEILNLRAATPEAPAELADIYEPTEYAKSQRYLWDNTHFDLLTSTVMLGLILLFMLAGGFGWLHRVAQHTSGYMIVQGLVFTGLLLVLMKLIGLPFSIYDTFVIEERYGFNRTTAKTFVLDLVKGLVLSAFFGFLFSPISMLLGILGNWISRKHEYEADRFAVRTTGGCNALVAALKKLTAHNMGNLTPHPFKVFVEYSHPPLRKRLCALDSRNPANYTL